MRVRIPRYRILVIDDNPADSNLVERFLSRVSAFTAEVVKETSHEAGLARLQQRGADCVVLDYLLGPTCGVDTLRAIRDSGDDTAVVFVTGFGNEMVAVKALQCGAQDYLVKSVLSPEVLQRAILNAVEKVTLNRRLDAKQRELEDFVSVVAHDLQQPLCAVKGNVELIRDFYSVGFDAQGVEFADAAVRTSIRMAEMIDALLGYARAGRDRAPVQSLDLNDLLGAVKNDLSELISRSDAIVEVEPLPTIVGDPVTLAQLFQNLIANAIKFRGEQPPEVTVGGDSDGETATVWVRDNGMGIPEGSLKGVFAPFRRLPQAKGRPGSGIGLATCKKIAEQHRGRIWAESELGCGSTFYVSLRASADGSLSYGQLLGLRVLMVDRDSSSSSALANALESRGLSVHAAQGLEEAKEMVDREQFDALVVDLTPGESGPLELIRQVRTRSPSTAVLAVTAGDGRVAPGPILDEARQQGADHVLPKPLDSVQVAALLRRMVPESKAISPTA